MNELMQKIALDCGLLNYVDLETPRHYFVHADIEEEDIEQFALRCVRFAIGMLEQNMHEELENHPKLSSSVWSAWYKAVIEVENAFREGLK